MLIRRLAGRLFCLLLIISLAIPLLAEAALAQPETIDLVAAYTRLESHAPRDGFQFIVGLRYQGYRARDFDLRASGPPGWTTYVTLDHGSTIISAIELEPEDGDAARVKVTAVPPPHRVTPPGEYRILLTCSSGPLSDSIELTAAVLPSYSASLTLFREQYYNEIKADRENTLAMSIRNIGGGTISDIMLTAEHPAGWSVVFDPEEIGSLTPDDLEAFDLIVRPDADVTSGNYQITVIASSDQMRTEREIRFRVEKFQTVWLWVGVAVICVVIAGFIIVYLRFGRRQIS